MKFFFGKDRKTPIVAYLKKKITSDKKLFFNQKNCVTLLDLRLFSYSFDQVQKHNFYQKSLFCHAWILQFFLQKVQFKSTI